MEMEILSFSIHLFQKKSNPLFDKIEWDEEINSG